MARTASISSAANPLLKDVRRALARGGLTAEGWWVAETFHLFEEARRSGCDIRIVLVAESQAALLEGIEATVVPDALLRSVSGTETSPGVIALIKPREWTAEHLFQGVPLVVVLDQLQDPGNVGTIVRTAEAFGATGAIFVKGTASPYNSKTLRASAGSLFRVPVIAGVDAEAARATLRERGVELLAGVRPVDIGARALSSVDLARACALAIGNEARGVSEALRQDATMVSIATVGVESLNAAVAAGILLYEAHRQRTARS
jgi:TrmH family RNA methyltransferase